MWSALPRVVERAQCTTAKGACHAVKTPLDRGCFVAGVAVHGAARRSRLNLVPWFVARALTLTWARRIRLKGEEYLCAQVSAPQTDAKGHRLRHQAPRRSCRRRRARAERPSAGVAWEMGRDAAGGGGLNRCDGARLGTPPGHQASQYCKKPACSCFGRLRRAGLGEWCVLLHERAP